ncbi:MAG: Methyltransferase type 11 [Bacteroidetes bacterium]|nr:Methyltransferase type 11 [Bacteroidota bacterium]
MSDNFEQKAKTWDNPMQVELTKRFVERICESIFLYKEDKIAEIGCGTGLVGLQIAPIVEELYMIDNSPSMLNVLREKLSNSNLTNVQIVESEFEETNLNDLSGVISFLTLHHIDYVPEFIDVMKDKLKDNGFIAIGDLISEDGSFHGETKVPYNGFDIEILSTILEQKGFVILRESIYDIIEKNDKKYPVFLIIAQK